MFPLADAGMFLAPSCLPLGSANLQERRPLALGCRHAVGAAGGRLAWAGGGGGDADSVPPPGEPDALAEASEGSAPAVTRLTDPAWPACTRGWNLSANASGHLGTPSLAGAPEPLPWVLQHPAP